MQVQLNKDSNIRIDEDIVRRLEGDLESALERFGDRITRVEVHLGDENAAKSGVDDKRCSLEARVAGQQPIAVTHHAGSVKEAFDGAVGRLQKLLDSRIGRSGNHKGGPSIRHMPVDDSAL
ncbi:HPF/RaiA family ribosome-associated protein [Rhodococcus phenolicus]|uniref:HPF/RaiA family ribosome-associated protein n=1 Tax=Rhodococcus phenolicus TaxID=263849 RepID=UPI000836A1E6|nr:HPF/RaiA family ribosome-associated protein [Rhodococcus phenolicus]